MVLSLVIRVTALAPAEALYVITRDEDRGACALLTRWRGLRQRQLTFSPAGNQRAPTLRGLRTEEAAMERSNGGVRKLLGLAGLARGEFGVSRGTEMARGPVGFEACA